MIRFLFRAILALLMLGIVFGLVGLYLWEVTGEDDYTPPAGVEDRENASGEQSFDGEGNFFLSPQWSPDGNFIVFTSINLVSEVSSIWVAASDGSSLTNLSENSQSQDASPAWSPNGQQIAFVSSRSDNLDIWMMDIDGLNPINLTPDVAEDFEPKWSPDGRIIAYQAQIDDRFELRVVNVESREIAILADAPSNDYSDFDWSPNSPQIAVLETIVTENNPESNTTLELPQLSIYSVDGFLLQTYHPTRPVSDVEWSPNGDRFLLNVSGNSDSSWVQFIIMNFDGSEQEVILPDLYTSVGNWSPDGGLIVFSAGSGLVESLEEMVSDNSSISVVSADGSNFHNLTEEINTTLSVPVWSPDGSKIAFSGRQDELGDSDIWVMNADGSNLMNLTGGE